VSLAWRRTNWWRYEKRKGGGEEGGTRLGRCRQSPREEVNRKTEKERTTKNGKGKEERGKGKEVGQARKKDKRKRKENTGHHKTAILSSRPLSPHTHYYLTFVFCAVSPDGRLKDQQAVGWPSPVPSNRIVRIATSLQLAATR
jgi:hypothetical protein